MPRILLLLLALTFTASSALAEALRVGMSPD